MRSCFSEQRDRAPWGLETRVAEGQLKDRGKIGRRLILVQLSAIPPPRLSLDQECSAGSAVAEHDSQATWVDSPHFRDELGSVRRLEALGRKVIREPTGA